MTVIDVLGALYNIPARLSLHRDDGRPYEEYSLCLDVEADKNLRLDKKCEALPAAIKYARVTFISFDQNDASRLVIEAFLDKDDFDMLSDSEYPGIREE